MDETWTTTIEKVAGCLSQKESYQRTIGEAASLIVESYGNKALKELSVDIKDTYGLTISPSTLRNYAWVHKMTSKLDLPDDLPYRTIQAIAGSENASEWAKRILDEGLSGAEVYNLIRKEKGLDLKPKKKYICEKCGASNEV